MVPLLVCHCEPPFFVGATLVVARGSEAISSQ
jgi:hypothetical protein